MRVRTHVFCISALSGALALGCAKPAPLAPAAAAPVAAQEASYDPVLARMGADAYQRWCASCHGVDGRGDGPAAAALGVAPADLTRIAERREGRFPPGEVARYIDGRFEFPAHGNRAMPVWGQRFSEDIPEPEIAESVGRGNILVLVEYLKSIQVRD